MHGWPSSVGNASNGQLLAAAASIQQHNFLYENESKKAYKTTKLLEQRHACHEI